MTLEELMAERERLIAEKEENNLVITSCRAQIDAARLRASLGEETLNKRWLVAVKTRARYAGRHDQKLAHEIAELRKKIWDAKADHNLDEDNPEELLGRALHLIHQALDVIRLKRREEED